MTTKTKTYSIHSALFLAIASISSSLFSLYPLYTFILLIVYRSLYLCFDVVSSCSCIFVFGFSCSSYRPALGFGYTFILLIVYRSLYLCFDVVSSCSCILYLVFRAVLIDLHLVLVSVYSLVFCLCFALATTFRAVDTHLHLPGSALSERTASDEAMPGFMLCQYDR